MIHTLLKDLFRRAVMHTNV